MVYRFFRDTADARLCCFELHNISKIDKRVNILLKTALFGVKKGVVLK